MTKTYNILISTALIASMLFSFAGCYKSTLNEVDDVCTQMDDIKFMKYCYDNFDVNKDGKVSMEEANAVTIIDVSYKGITSLKGLEYFRRITELDCHKNSISSLNLKDYSNLSYLCCYGNKLSSLDISNLNEMPRDWNTVIEYEKESYVVPKTLFSLILPQDTAEEIMIYDKKENWDDKKFGEVVPVDSDMYHAAGLDDDYHFSNYKNIRWKWILK